MPRYCLALDLKNDPDEKINEYDNPKHRALIVKMKKELRALMKTYKDDEALKILDKA